MAGQARLIGTGLKWRGVSAGGRRTDPEGCSTPIRHPGNGLGPNVTP